MQRTSRGSNVPPMVRVVALAALFATIGCTSAPRETPAALAVSSTDQRTAVVLPADGQQAVLREMRQMLGALGGTMAAARNGDTTALLAAVAPALSSAAADLALEAMLPPAWNELAERTHGGFDSLAAAARRTKGARALEDTVLARLPMLIVSCTSCHETFRVAVR
jgi:cytochrome c556